MDLEKLKAELRRDEGYRCYVYRCSTGHRTIGYGHMDDGMPDGTVCSRETAEAWLEEDIKKATRIAELFIYDRKNDGEWERLSDARQRALVNMAFNLGARLMQFKRFRAALLAGNYDQAAEEMLDSLYAKQVGDRAQRIATMLRTG